jgi:hypothetical protein
LIAYNEEDEGVLNFEYATEMPTTASVETTIRQGDGMDEAVGVDELMRQ